MSYDAIWLQTVKYYVIQSSMDTHLPEHYMQPNTLYNAKQCSTITYYAEKKMTPYSAIWCHTVLLMQNISSFTYNAI